MPFESYKYRLRAGNPTPRCAEGGTDFILQTFKAEKIKVFVDEARRADALLRSEDFRGQGGHFMQASYQRLPYKFQDGTQVFSSTEETYPDNTSTNRRDDDSTAEQWDSIYIDEDDIPGS